MVSDGPLKEIRKQAGRTQEEIADAVGIDQSYLSLLESGARVPSDHVRGKLAEALGVPVEVLRPALSETTTDASASGDDK